MLCRGTSEKKTFRCAQRGRQLSPTSGQSAPFNPLGDDSAGNLVSRTRKTTTADPAHSMAFSWTAYGRLAQVMEGTVSRFTASYAGDGERVQKTDTTGTRTYHWGLQDTGDHEEDTRSYTTGVGYRNGLVATFHYQHEDHAGSTRYVSTNMLPGSPHEEDAAGSAPNYDVG